MKLIRFQEYGNIDSAWTYQVQSRPWRMANSRSRWQL